MRWTKVDNEHYVNRMPICVLYYKCIAEKLGYSSDIAKLLAVGRAKFFAAAKISRGFSSNNNSNSFNNRKFNTNSNHEVIHFAGCVSYVELDDNGNIKKVSFSNNEITKDQYDNQIAKIEVKSGFAKKLENIIKNKIKNISNSELNGSGAYAIYEKYRDIWRSRKFLNEITC